MERIWGKLVFLVAVLVLLGVTVFFVSTSSLNIAHSPIKITRTPQ